MNNDYEESSETQKNVSKRIAELNAEVAEIGEQQKQRDAEMRIEQRKLDEAKNAHDEAKVCVVRCRVDCH